jgi:glycosyltransferase involved in cell wall biosynthesis
MPEALVPDGRPVRVVIVVNEDWMFWSHRLALARALRDAGADVTVATRVTAHREAIAAEGFDLAVLPWRRGTRNPWREVQTVRQLRALYRAVRPDAIHHVGVKASLYGGLAARLAGSPPQIHTIAGFGFVSVSRRRRARLLRALLGGVFRRVLSRPRAYLVVQNRDDLAAVRRGNLFAGERTRLIPGSGVDTDAFRPSPEPDGAVTVVLAGRLIRPKGVVQLVDASRLLRERGKSIRVVLVGDPDPENPDTVRTDELLAWQRDGLVEWIGRRDDMPAVWASCHIAVLPSYREGMPRTLLEAAASGRPLIATDVPGCRDLVDHGENGLLVALHDARALADAIERLAGDAATRTRMGGRARTAVEARFCDAVIVKQMLELYRVAIASRRGS